MRAIRWALVALPCLALCAPTLAQTGAGLQGTVTSEREGPMEGVVVMAHRVGSPITVSVVSNASGAYAFPPERLPPGAYDMRVRAAGYDLAAPLRVDVSAKTAAKTDLALRPAEQSLDSFTNAELMAAAPGPEAMKKLMLNCTDCHSLHRIFNSTHTAQEFLQVLDRMGGYYPGAWDMQPQRLVGDHKRPPIPPAQQKAYADYLAGLNLNGRSQSPIQPKSFERPRGRATQVIMTEYELPRREIQPHDVIVDGGGTVWYSNFGEQYLSKMDPQTGKVTEFPIPIQKPGYPTGTLDLEIDHEGHLWIGLMYQSGVARFDPKAETFRIYPLPAEWQTDATQQSHISVAGLKADGKIWVKNSDRSQVMRLDPASGHYDNLGSFKTPRTGQAIGIYGIYADSRNDAYILEFGSGGIGRIDAKTNALTFFETPSDGSRARRGRVDAQDRLWFAEFGSNGVGMFDPKTEKISEWKMPMPWEAPYDVVATQDGVGWAVNEASDRIHRIDSRTGEITAYLLPRYGNIRRVFVDERGSRPVVWMGNNLNASILKVEPLD